MTSLNEIRELFFVECDEQLEQLADGLAAIEAGGGRPDPAIVNTIFRASIRSRAARPPSRWTPSQVLPTHSRLCWTGCAPAGWTSTRRA